MTLPIPSQPTALRRAADRLDARAEVALQQAKGAVEAERRVLNARVLELRDAASRLREKADAVEGRQG
jgi:uncharacterized coiled-coil DUF342 family protein